MPIKTLLLPILCAFAVPAAVADEFLVENGRPRAEVVIAEQAPRTTRLAARELQTYIAKISGATLPIVTKPGEDLPVKVYVGRSSHADRLGVSADGLRHGAYRIVSGDGRLVLMGDDTQFTPIEPWPRNHSDWTSGRVHEEWDRITGATWGNPMPQLRKHYTGRAHDFGKPPHQRVDKSDTIHVWGFDERGSLNAVCGFLRRLGVRWYMPGELGEVIPSMASIPLPKIDETVRPDFAVRRFNIRFGVHGRDTAMWAMRLGVRDPYGLQIAHGMHCMTRRDEIRRAHPDWFALYGGKRDVAPGKKTNQLCYSNEELFGETLRYVRAVMDHYRFDVVSVMPPDGYVSICQCPLCEGKDAPERDYRGRLSDYVWEFVNRVGREIKKTHPDKMVSCCAYGTYTLPPERIDKLESNVLVCIVGGRRPTSSRPEQQEEIRRLRQSWLPKTGNPIMIFENYPFTGRGWYLPSYVPHVIGRGINATKGISQGEDIWLTVSQDFAERDIGLNHFLVYFTARMYWGGKEQDVDAMFDEYCRLFYGPAAAEMKSFFEYCETHWQEMERDKATVDRALELFAAAESKADAESVYGRRIALVDDYLEALRNKRVQLARRRGPVPHLRLARDAEGIVIDGRLDDEFWQNCPYHATGRLKELQTGRKPIFGTTFQAAWGKDGSLYFAIRCEERKGGRPNIGATRDDDPAVWYGDAVEVLLETEAHSYYQIAINPAGAVVDLDRGADKRAWYGWHSKAEVGVNVADDCWTVELRLPVVEDENDPLNQIIGRKPTGSLPWHFNVCRQRIREDGTEHSAFSPTGMKGFHEVMKFGQLYEGKSRRFDAAETERDYPAARHEALTLVREGKREQAIDALAALAASDVTELQRSDALEQAATLAAGLQRFDRAMQLAAEIPIAAVAGTVRMRILRAMREPEQIVERFGDENIAKWPFWKAGEALYLRGRAFADVGSGERAEADLAAALELTTDHRARLDVRLALGANRENNLDDTAAALAAYRQIATASRNTGSATYYRGVQGAARILRNSGRSDEALATLRKVDAARLHGYWHGSMHVALGKTLAAAGRTDEALAAYRAVLANQDASGADRRAAGEAIEAAGAPQE